MNVSVEPRTQAGLKLRDYLRDSFVYEADDTEQIDVTDRILAVEDEAAATGRARFAHLYNCARLVSQWHQSMNSGPLEELDAELGELRRLVEAVSA